MTGTPPADLAATIRERDDLRQSQARLAHSQRVAGLGSWELDPVAGTVTGSDQLYRLFGVDPEVFRPSLESFFALVHPADQERVSAALAQATETKAPVTIEHRIVRPDGTVRFVRLNADVTLAADGSVALICGTDQDITDLKEVEEQLRREHETLELVGRATNDAVWERVLPGLAMTWHHGFEAYGYSWDDIEALSRSGVSLVHPDDLERVQSATEAAVAGGDDSWSCRFRFRRADASYVMVLARAHIVRDPGAAGVRMVGSLLDLTDHERLQDLDRRKEATAVVLGRASHELRTPLNAILGFSELLEDQLRHSITERQVRYIQNIRAAGTQLLGLIDDVLDLSKAASGRIELAFEEIALERLIEPVIASAREQATAKGVGLSVDAPDDLPLCLDATRVRQILDNLLSNAVKFTPAGGNIALAAALDGRALHLTVADTGQGIAIDRQDRLFGAFDTLSEDQPALPGSGLGLALSRQLVELHGGSITFRSNEDEGTTFSVVLPDAFEGPVPGDRVLVVEDHRHDAALIVELVIASGLAVEVARTLGHARRAISRALPRAVILDLQLPDGRGEAFLDALRADPATRVLPVIVVTGVGVARAALVRGADEQLSKPLDHARLRRWLAGVAATAGVPAVAPGGTA